MSSSWANKKDEQNWSLTRIFLSCVYPGRHFSKNKLETSREASILISCCGKQSSWKFCKLHLIIIHSQQFPACQVLFPVSMLEYYQLSFIPFPKLRYQCKWSLPPEQCCRFPGILHYHSWRSRSFLSSLSTEMENRKLSQSLVQIRLWLPISRNSTKEKILNCQGVGSFV